MLFARYIKLKEGPVLIKKTMFGPQFFVKNETWIGFGLQKPNANDDSFAPFKPNSLISFYGYTIQKEK